ncbi:putative deoxyribonuclease [Nymphaea thermarum]|nr:putative deoxyribonuclease [Nymphaea thermarum]
MTTKAGGFWASSGRRRQTIIGLWTSWYPSTFSIGGNQTWKNNRGSKNSRGKKVAAGLEGVAYIGEERTVTADQICELQAYISHIGVHKDECSDDVKVNRFLVVSGNKDIAVNFTDGMFKGIYNNRRCHAADLPVVLQRAWNAGVDRIIVTGGSLQESREALAIAETDGRLFCTVGVHPTRCMEFEESGDPELHFQELLSLARQGAEKGKVVAVGECGLDYDRTHFCSPEVQKRYFERQFELAAALKLPMFLHMRAAAEDFCDILSRNKHLFTTGVAHSFTGSAKDCDLLLKFTGLYIGINGCSLKTPENLSVVGAIPIERLMIETDSPYCEIKSTHAGNRQVLEVLAACKCTEDIHGLARTIFQNTCRVFFPQDLDAAADGVNGDGC